VDKSQIENIAAALSELEAEKQRRIDEKVEKGEAVRVPALSIVVGASEEVGAAIKDKLAALRAAGETREIYFEEPSVIVTGVPRAGRDDEYSAALARGDHKASRPRGGKASGNE
jgi:hypothetical protein